MKHSFKIVTVPSSWIDCFAYSQSMGWPSFHGSPLSSLFSGGRAIRRQMPCHEIEFTEFSFWACFQRLEGSALYFLFLTSVIGSHLKIQFKNSLNSAFKLANRNDTKITKPWILGILMLDSKNSKFFERREHFYLLLYLIILPFIIILIYFLIFLSLLSFYLLSHRVIHTLPCHL